MPMAAPTSTSAWNSFFSFTGLPPQKTAGSPKKTPTAGAVAGVAGKALANPIAFETVRKLSYSASRFNPLGYPMTTSARITV